MLKCSGSVGSDNYYHHNHVKGQDDRWGSIGGMDSCDYNSNSSGYFDEHHEFDNQ